MKKYYGQICGPNLPQITYRINGFRKCCVEEIVLRKISADFESQNQHSFLSFGKVYSFLHNQMRHMFSQRPEAEVQNAAPLLLDSTTDYSTYSLSIIPL